MSKQKVCAACGGPIAGPHGEMQHFLAADCVAFCRRPGFSRHPARPGSSLKRVTITLEEEEYEQLSFALRTATADARHNGNTGLFNRLVRLANNINAGNPRWVPYEVETEAAP